MGCVLPSFGLSPAQTAGSLSRHARMTPPFTCNLPSETVSKEDEAD